MSDSPRHFWSFHSAGRIVFGSDSALRLPDFLQRWKPHRVLIVTDQILIKAGIVDTVIAPLQKSGVSASVFDGGEPEPSIDVALSALEMAKRVQPEVIVGVGGGSNMDVAKIVSNVFVHGGSLCDYFGYDKIPGPILPLVCLPTTSGTGSEVSHAAVLTDTANQMKVSTLSQFLRPDLAVVDPKLTLTCPERPTADSGIDALTHAIEALTATRFDELNVSVNEAFPYEGKQPIGDCLAERAIELIGRHLIKAVHEPSNLEAREGMSLAATMAGLAFSNNAVAIVHALEYPLGGTLHCSHGAGNGLLLPHVMKFNLPSRIPEFHRIAQLLGENVDGMSIEEGAKQAIAGVERISRKIGIPQRIRDLGGKREQLPEFASKSFAIKRLMLLNPRQPTESDLLSILEAAF